MKYLRWLPALAYAGLIFYLSSRAWPAPTELPAGTDKVIHLCIYAVLGFVLLWALRTTRLKDHPFLVVIAGCMGFAYGVFDEIHQAFVPGRTPSVWDAIADGIGSFTGAWIALRYAFHRHRIAERIPCANVAPESRREEI